MQHNGLYIIQNEHKGRCVHTSKDYLPGDVIEICPVIVIPRHQLALIHHTVLHDYYFTWGENDDEAAIALGYGSLYNHSDQPNAKYLIDINAHVIYIDCIAPIAAGDEIVIKYIDDDSDVPLWFDKNKP